MQVTSLISRVSLLKFRLWSWARRGHLRLRRGCVQKNRDQDKGGRYPQQNRCYSACPAIAFSRTPRPVEPESHEEDGTDQQIWSNLRQKCRSAGQARCHHQREQWKTATGGRQDTTDRGEARGYSSRSAGRLRRFPPTSLL